MLYRYKSTNESESTKSTDESEDPSGTLSGENEDGSESFESAFESHNPCNEPNINRVIDDFKSEVMGELLEIKRELKKKDNTNLHELLEMKREMKKKDNFVLDLLGRLDANQRQQNDANQWQQNGQIRQSTSPQDTPMGQQTVHTNQNKNVQSYATSQIRDQNQGQQTLTESLRQNHANDQNQNSNQNQGQRTPMESQRQNHANGRSTAAAANNLPLGLNEDNTRYHHSHNNRGGPNQAPNQSRENNNKKQPKTVRNNYLDINPDTGNVKLIKDFKTGTKREEKTQEKLG